MREHKVDYEGYRLWYDDRVPVEKVYLDPSGRDYVLTGPFRWEVRRDGREIGTATTFGEAKALVDAVKNAERRPKHHERGTATVRRVREARALDLGAVRERVIEIDRGAGREKDQGRDPSGH